MQPESAGRRHLLWDASAVISYYLPETAATRVAAERVRTIIDAVRNHRVDIHFYIPDIVVAEVFVAFDRNHYSTWDPKVNKKYGGKGKSLHQRRYLSARDRFRRDITNGALFYQLELNRYHVLGLDLIAPVDKHLKFYRKGNVLSMGASDLLIGSMALHLTRIQGRDASALITTDRRMEAIFDRACCNLNENTARALQLPETAKRLGFGSWTPAMCPRVIDVGRCTKAALAEWFGAWPLPTGKIRNRAPKA